MWKVFLFALIALAGAAAQDKPPQTFTSGVTMIQTPVTVRDRDGHAVASLEKQDFLLFDNGNSGGCRRRSVIMCWRLFPRRRRMESFIS